MYLQERLLHQVLGGGAVSCGFTQETEQARGNRIVQVGKRSAVAVGVALHCGVGAVNAWARQSHLTLAPERCAVTGESGKLAADALAASRAPHRARQTSSARFS